ncbi:MAG: FkbM family methyltransferase [Opitutaceae bacterium]|nr:FkbM family methyltransferase [Opitutaceae bacterium]
MSEALQSKITGWRRTFHLKLRFGMSKLPIWPTRYRLTTDGHPDFTFWWTHVIPFMSPEKGAFDFELYGWDVRELRFLRRFLQPGMTFVDLGAHHGLYSVLAAALVGPTGRVIAFEPAPASARRLRWHATLNGVNRIEVHRSALGARASTATLFVPQHGIDTVSSLRPPAVGGGGPTHRIEVNVVSLDDFASSRDLKEIDLVKLDVEGAEADVLDGAARVCANLAPLWIFEALDSTSATWGSSGRKLVTRFADLGHELFEFNPEGRLLPHQLRDAYPLDSNCNLLAVPRGKIASVDRRYERSEVRA